MDDTETGSDDADEVVDKEIKGITLVSLVVEAVFWMAFRMLWRISLPSGDPLGKEGKINQLDGVRSMTTV